MRDWTPPARVTGTTERHQVCMAAFFIAMGGAVFLTAVLAALGVINLLG